MSQKKNSEATKLNQIKRELAITLRVLENELNTFNECVEDCEPNKAQYNQNNIGTLYLRDSLKSSIEYLKDLKEDCASKVSESYQHMLSWYRHLSDCIYEKYNNKELCSAIMTDEIELLNDRLDYPGFRSINFDHFEFIQRLLFIIESQGPLYEEQINYLVEKGYITITDKGEIK